MIFKHICLKCILRKSITQTHVQHQKLWSEQPKLKTLKAKLATVKSPRQRKHTFSDDAAFVKPNFPFGASNKLEASRFVSLRRLWNCWNFNTLYQINIRQNSKAKLCNLNAKSWIFRIIKPRLWWILLQEANARLRGWQRTTTKLKHNNHNHLGSMGLETPRVDSPSWGVCYVYLA